MLSATASDFEAIDGEAGDPAAIEGSVAGPDGRFEPRIHIDPPIVDPIAVDPPIIDDPSEKLHSLLDDFRVFLADHPAWLSDHGADGIELQVMTESQYVSGLFLSTPGTARAFDAWIEQTYLMVDGETPYVEPDDSWVHIDDPVIDFPVVEEPVIVTDDLIDEPGVEEPSIDDPCPVFDEPFIDGPCPSFDIVEARTLAFATIASDHAKPNRQWMGQAMAFLFFPGPSAEAAAPARPKRIMAAPVVHG